MHTRPLGKTGMNVSVLGFGASPLGGVFRDTDDAQSIQAVHTALDEGINFFDTSPYYGNTRSETVLGKALRGIARDRYHLATKVGQYGSGQFDFSADRVTRSLDESCVRLGVDRIDLLQCHDIEFADLEQIVNETLPALAKLRQAGRIRAIGITGLPLKIFPAVLDRVPRGTVDTVLSFCRYELNDAALGRLIPYFEERGVGVINAAPTGMGLLTERGVPDWHPAPPEMIECAKRAVAYCRGRGEDIVKLAIQFSVAHPGIATTVIGTASADNVRKNARYARAPIDFALMADVLAQLKPIADRCFTRGRPENRDT